VPESCPRRLKADKYGNGYGDGQDEVSTQFRYFDFSGVFTSGVDSRMGAVLRIEGNVFENTKDPITSLDSSEVGFWDVADNQFINSTGNQPTISNGRFVPPYNYPLDNSGVVKALVTQWAGVGKTDPLQNLP